MDSFAILLAVGLLGAYFIFDYSSGNPPSVSDDGKRTIVRYGRGARWVIVVVAAIPLVITVAEYFDRSEDRGVLYVFLLMAIILGPYLLCEGFRTRFEYDNDQLRATTAFKNQRSFAWTEIADISYSSWTSTYVLKMRNGSKLAISEYLSGSEVLMDFARRWKSYNRKTK